MSKNDLQFTIHNFQFTITYLYNVRFKHVHMNASSGEYRIRTDDPLLAKQVL